MVVESNGGTFFRSDDEDAKRYRLFLNKLTAATSAGFECRRCIEGANRVTHAHVGSFASRFGRLVETRENRFHAIYIQNTISCSHTFACLARRNCL